MSEPSGSHPYDLEERTFIFARDIRAFVKQLPRTICNVEDVRQVVRSSRSVGANYIEANDALGKNDFKLHIRISKKESIESRYWLRLLDTHCIPVLEVDREKLIRESVELMNIFGAILRKSE